MKDTFGFQYYLELAKDWYIASSDAKRRGFFHLAKLFEQFGNEATHKQQECI